MSRTRNNTTNIQIDICIDMFSVAYSHTGRVLYSLVIIKISATYSRSVICCGLFKYIVADAYEGDFCRFRRRPPLHFFTVYSNLVIM